MDAQVEDLISDTALTLRTEQPINETTVGGTAMSANVDLNNRPDYDKVLQDIADYVLNLQDRVQGSAGHRAQLPDGYLGLWPVGVAFPGVHQAPGADRRGYGCAVRCACAGYPLSVWTR